ncbi:hypothetical protein RJ640_030387, partial [Escallonia rubra]
PYWRCYFPNTQAIIYVVDSSDTDRLIIAKEEFHAILEEEELKGAVVLIFANKQDLPGALDDAAVTEALELHKIKNRQWAIFKTSAIKGEGLFEGLDWLRQLPSPMCPFGLAMNCLRFVKIAMLLLEYNFRHALNTLQLKGVLDSSAAAEVGLGLVVPEPEAAVDPEPPEPALSPSPSPSPSPNPPSPKPRSRPKSFLATLHSHTIAYTRRR